DGTPISLHLSDDGKYAFVGAEEQDTVYIVSVAEKTIVQTIKPDPGAGPDPVQLTRGAR
ncbi:MAG: hypothetical protein GY953_46680, partial [bacterium]|nr:hypothetical protein [bacterium]